MKASLKKALADYDLYLNKLGIDKIKKRKDFLLKVSAEIIILLLETFLLIFVVF